MTASATTTLVRQIHRWEGGFTALCSKVGRWRECVCSSAELTEETLCRLNLVGTPDSYFSLNTFNRPKRTNSNALFLNAVWVDIDPIDGNGQLDFWELSGEIRVRQQRGYIPEFSFLVDSGRGVWGLILLTGVADGTQPQIATAEAMRLQQKINRELASRLADLGADPAVHDVARVTRIPFSINGKTRRPVVYYPQQDASGRIPTSTLEQLAAFLDLAQTTTPVIAAHIPNAQGGISTRETFKLTSPADPQRSEWGRQGQRARFEKEIDGLRSLERLRKGFSEGQRSNAVFVQSVLLRVLRYDQREIETQAKALGSRCSPPLAEEKCLKMAAAPHIARYSRFPWTRRKILRLLGVTVSEQSQIGEWKPKQKRCPANFEKKTAERRQLELSSIHNRGPLSLSEMRAYLLTLGHVVSRETINRDYAALGIVGKGNAGRRKAENQEPNAHPRIPPTLGFRVDNSFCGRERQFSLLRRGFRRGCGLGGSAERRFV